MTMLVWFLAVLLAVLRIQPSNSVDSLDALDEDSVVLITGAAGFIGSELAMALYRTYSPKKMILVDSMDTLSSSHDEVDPSSSQRGPMSEEDLALFEFKRQRIFHVLQTIGSRAHFYRVDMRPTIPELFDHEVPVLDHIFQQHSDITHVVHLADPYHRGVLQLLEDPNTITTQAVPRQQFQKSKAGMMEGLLEQLRKMGQETGRVPHLVFASSYEVYNHLYHQDASQRQRPMSEDVPLTTPSTLAGASKLMQEIVAQTYYETDGIFSVALRFFCVYGPWSLPGSPLFVLSERAVTGESPPLPEEAPEDLWDHERDYVYIDDAVDAIMSAMQFRPFDTTAPVAINVGTGQGRTLREIATKMQEFFPQLQVPPTTGRTDQEPTVSLASTERARRLLGFEAQVPFSQGLENLLSWHYDRAFPYGDGKEVPYNSTRKEDYISVQGVVACNRYDAECLRGTPVFPCASECAHTGQCTTSFYDDVVDFTRQLTADCTNVMYTVSLQSNVSVIPSAEAQVSINSKSFVEEGEFCNVAFVSDTSPLVQRLYSDKKAIQQPFQNSDQVVLQHGFFSIIPVTVTKYATEKINVLSLLPKLSPGHFFSSGKTRKVIYADPTVIFDNVPLLLSEAAMQPFSEDVAGTTAMLIGKDAVRAEKNRRKHANMLGSTKSTVQEHAYRTMRMALIDQLEENAYAQHVDSSFVVHTVNSEDSRLFRCDVFGDVVQWDVDSDTSAFEFIMNLHDMWSRVLVKEAGQTPWWIGDEVESIPEDKVTSEERRRLTTDDEQPTKKNLDVLETWMGILSSTEVQNFARLVPTSTLGVVHLDDYPVSAVE